jgi:hypothetical protein
MGSFLTPGRSVLAGSAVLMACACGAGASSAKLLQVWGIGATAKVTHPMFMLLAAGLMLYGLIRKSRGLAALALAGFAILAVAAMMTPPMAMSTRALPWSGTHITGALLYLLAAVAIGYAIWRAFPTSNGAASGTAIAGTALATGCQCCLVTGAAAGLIVAMGGTPSFFMGGPAVFIAGLAIAATGLVALAGWRPLLPLAAGGVVYVLGPKAIQLAPNLMYEGVNLRFIPGYLVYLIGASIIMIAFGVAYQFASERRAQPAVPEPDPATA